MPLAAARNRAAAAARGDQLIFLDVDCVPAPTLVGRYAATAIEPGGIRLGEVLYLPAGALDAGLDWDKLDRVGLRHPAKPSIAPDEIRPTPSHGELWGLSFAISAADWARAGGDGRALCRLWRGGNRLRRATRARRGADVVGRRRAGVSPASCRPHACVPAFRRDHPQCAVVSRHLGAVVHGLLAGAFRRARADRLGCGYDYGVAGADRRRGGRVENAAGGFV
nr:glycosyltransferase [Sphingomonas sp. H160509]